jgi:hypothetical protein
MALFTDGNASDVADLRAYDAAIAEVAAAEGVALQAKLELAMQEIGVELEEFLVRATGGQAQLSQVVVTPALKQWHTLRTLALIYGDIHNSHVNRRFEGKWADYKMRARWAAESLFRIGVGLVSNPIPKAAAPQVRTLAGRLEPGTYLIKVAWVNERGESGAPSEAAVETLAAAGGLGIRAIHPPPVAAGFHVWVGNSEKQLWRQTAAPQGLGSEWVCLGPLERGSPPTAGQEPERYVRNERILRRG